MGYIREAIAKRTSFALFRGIWMLIDLVKAKQKLAVKKRFSLDVGRTSAYYVLDGQMQKYAEKPKIIRGPLVLAGQTWMMQYKNYEKSIALRPNFIMYRLDLRESLH